MSTKTTGAFDPARQVPDEYDVFCEACGYSLAGLMGDRCPECGKTFDPAELPFARLPWLHRRRLGKLNAYARTVFLVCFRPASVARELCRPVRISVKDARSFRLATLWLVTIAFAVIAAALAILGLLWLSSRPKIPAQTVSMYIFGTLVG